MFWAKDQRAATRIAGNPCSRSEQCYSKVVIEYYASDSLGTLFETIPDAYIRNFPREAGFFYLMWIRMCQLFIWVSHRLTKFWTRFNSRQLNNTTSLCNSFIEHQQGWGKTTCEGRLIWPEGHVSLLNKCIPIQLLDYVQNASQIKLYILICIQFFFNIRRKTQ